jgi:hypothetical protein
MEQAKLVELLSFVNAMPLSKIEKELGIPASTLSKAVKGIRPLSKKWDQPLIKFVSVAQNDFANKAPVKIELFNAHEDGRKAGKIKLYDEIAEWARQHDSTIWELWAWTRENYPKTSKIAPKEVMVPGRDPKNSIQERIEAILAEKIPEQRNTPLGRKSWNLEQRQRVEALKKELEGS